MSVQPASDPSVKEIFKRALEQAALGDLQFTLRIAEKRMMDYELPERTVEIMREMRARELSLIGVKGTKAMQTESLRLVSRYRESIPGYGSSLRRISFPVGLRKDGSRKWVSHRTVLKQRAVPLSLLDVQAIIHPAEPVSAPAPVKRKTVAKTQPPVSNIPAPTLDWPVKALAPHTLCPVCRGPRMLVKTSDTCFVCSCCMAVLQVTGFKRKESAAA
jgi:hypothetical protein